METTEVNKPEVASSEVPSPEVVSPEVPAQKSGGKPLITIVIVLLILLIIGGAVVVGYYVYKSRSDSEQETAVTDTEETSTETTDRDYDVAYEDGSFEIREKKVGEWESVTSFTDRLEITEYGPYDCKWEQNWEGIELIDETCSFETEHLQFETNYYKVTIEDYHHTLEKNDEVAWERDLTPGPCNAITGIKTIRNEVAVDYLSLDPQVNSIIVTEANSVNDILITKDYEDIFAPYEVSGKLIYVASEDDEQFLVYDDEEIGDKYDEIYYACCCEGVKYTVLGNGDYIDFFAKKGSDWYHVLAGDLDSLD